MLGLRAVRGSVHAGLEGVLVFFLVRPAQLNLKKGNKGTNLQRAV